MTREEVVERWAAAHPEKSKTYFEIGDHCRVREWDDMVAEFGYNDGYIDCPGPKFTEPMRGLCGKQFTIDAVTYDLEFMDGVHTGVYASIEGTEDFWNISAFMLELDSEHDFQASSITELMDMIGV